MLKIADTYGELVQQVSGRLCGTEREEFDQIYSKTDGDIDDEFDGRAPRIGVGCSFAAIQDCIDCNLTDILPAWFAHALAEFGVQVATARSDDVLLRASYRLGRAAAVRIGYRWPGDEAAVERIVHQLRPVARRIWRRFEALNLSTDEMAELEGQVYYPHRLMDDGSEPPLPPSLKIVLNGPYGEYASRLAMPDYPFLADGVWLRDMAAYFAAIPSNPRSRRWLPELSAIPTVAWVVEECSRFWSDADDDEESHELSGAAAEAFLVDLVAQQLTPCGRFPKFCKTLLDKQAWIAFEARHRSAARDRRALVMDLCRAALPLAQEDAQYAQRVRIGRRWQKTSDGTIDEDVVPCYHLTAEQYGKWLAHRVLEQARGLVFDREDFGSDDTLPFGSLDGQGYVRPRPVKDLLPAATSDAEQHSTFAGKTLRRRDRTRWFAGVECGSGEDDPTDRRSGSGAVVVNRFTQQVIDGVEERQIPASCGFVELAEVIHLADDKTRATLTKFEEMLFSGQNAEWKAAARLAGDDYARFRKAKARLVGSGTRSQVTSEDDPRSPSVREKYRKIYPPSDA